MQNFVKSYINALRTDKKRRHKAYLWLGLMSVIVAAVVFWQLSVPAVTMSKTLNCGLSEHTHVQACYALACESEDEGHVHAAECYSTEPSCGQEEHTHDANCYDVSLEDEAKDWDISAHFVESKTSEDGSTIEWIEKDSEFWDAGPKVEETEDGKTIVENNDYAVDKTKEKGNNKSITIRVRFKYTGDIKAFQKDELRIEVPNIMYGCTSRQLYVTDIILNSQSIFRFSDGVSAISTAQKINSDKLVFTNNTEVSDAKELQGYFDITYELASGSEYTSGTCELTKTEFADECTHNHKCNIKDITLLRAIPSDYLNSDDEYGFVAKYAAGSDEDGLAFEFTRRYIHPWCTPAIKILKSHSNMVPNYNARKLIADSNGIEDKNVVADYSWIRWELVYGVGANYGGVSIDQSIYEDQNKSTTPASRFQLLAGHKQYLYRNNDKLCIFSAGKLTTGGSYQMRMDNYIVEAFPIGCIVANVNGEILSPMLDENNNPIIDDTGTNYIYRMELSEGIRNGDGNAWIEWTRRFLVGYPKSTFVYNKDGSVKTEDERVINNTVELKAIGADGEDYSKLTTDKAILPIDQSGGAGNSFNYEISKEGLFGFTPATWNGKCNAMNGLLTGNGAAAPFWINVKLNDVPSQDGVDVIITDENFGIKKESSDQKLTEITKDECAITQLRIPRFVDISGAAVFGDVTVELTYSDGTTEKDAYSNVKQSWERTWNLLDGPCSFKITISNVHDSIEKNQIFCRVGLKSISSVLEKVDSIGVDFKAADYFYITNSARVTIRNSKDSSVIYTPGIASADEYLTTTGDPSCNGWYYWDADKTKAENGEQTNFRRYSANSRLILNSVQKLTGLDKLCTDNYDRNIDGYYYNTYSLKWFGTNTAPTNIGQSVTLGAGYYTSGVWQDFWKGYISAKNDNGTYKNPGIMYRKTTIFDIMPAGTELTCTAEQVKNSAIVEFGDEFYKAFRVSDGQEFSKERLKQLILENLDVTFTENYNGTGRTLITISFDVGENNEFVILVTHKKVNQHVISLKLDIDWRIGIDNILKYNYQTNKMVNKATFTLMDETGNQTGTNKDPDLMDETLKPALDMIYPRYGVSAHRCSITYAGAMMQGILDQVRTSELTTYLPDKVSEARRTGLAKDYGYQVRLAVLSSKITNAVFTDTLECNAGDEEYGDDQWSGTLKSIVMSDYKDVLAGITPTAVFTDAETGEQTPLVWNSDSYTFTPPDGAALSSGTLTIDLGAAAIQPDRYYSYYIYLTAPDAHAEGLTSNNATITYQKLNNETPDSQKFDLTGNRVFVKLGYSTEERSLQVSKVWNTGSKENAVIPDSIDFAILRDGEAYKTGKLTAADAWTATITGLPKCDQEDGHEYKYTVRENEVEGYASVVEYLDDGSSDGVIKAKITNTILGYDYVLKIVKTDDLGNRLAGAEFQLQTADSELLYTGVTDANGELSFGDPTKLTVGSSYKLIETRAPDGYTPLSSDAIAFTVSKTGETVTIDHDEKDNISAAWETDGSTLVITVENELNYSLPESGGLGVYPFVIGGLLLMAAPLIYIYVRRKERRSEN